MGANAPTLQLQTLNQHRDDSSGRGRGSINAVLDLKFGQEVSKIRHRRFLASEISDGPLY